MNDLETCLLCLRRYRGPDAIYCSARCRTRAAVPPGHDLSDKPKSYKSERYRAGIREDARTRELHPTSQPERTQQ